MTTDPRRRVVTFYSYKGGVGRSMALANVAWRLANHHGLSVVAVDWDLEAPGLHHFFGKDTAELKDTPGVLDFLMAWRAAIDAGAPEPPDARGWLIPINVGRAAPAYGSLSLLPAGKHDGGFGRRLAEFDWRPFYAESSGAVAVETLREQISERADIVLVDSRTGLTDAGGICAVQLPDGVVLMSVPNEQSMGGITRVAESIVRPGVLRAGRPCPRIWLALCRLPNSDDQVRWLENHQAAFDLGIERGLWRREDHLNGIASHAIPQVKRWGFGEPLVFPSPGILKDGLGMAFDKLAATLFRWLHGDLVRPTGVVSTATPEFQSARQRAENAKARNDLVDLGLAQLQLGHALYEEREGFDALDAYARAAGLALALGDDGLRGSALAGMGWSFIALGRLDDAVTRFNEALGTGSPESDVGWRAALHHAIGKVRREQGRLDEALAALVEGADDAQRSGDVELVDAIRRELIELGVSLPLEDEPPDDGDAPVE